jgi:hypothetical protein
LLNGFSAGAIDPPLGGSSVDAANGAGVTDPPSVTFAPGVASRASCTAGTDVRTPGNATVPALHARVFRPTGFDDVTVAERRAVVFVTDAQNAFTTCFPDSFLCTIVDNLPQLIVVLDRADASSTTLKAVTEAIEVSYGVPSARTTIVAVGDAAALVDDAFQNGLRVEKAMFISVSEESGAPNANVFAVSASVYPRDVLWEAAESDNQCGSPDCGSYIDSLFGSGSARVTWRFTRFHGSLHGCELAVDNTSSTSTTNRTAPTVDGPGPLLFDFLLRGSGSGT